DITWHGLPFNGEWEYMDGSIFEAGINLTHRMDEMFGVKRKTVVSQRDVPSITASSIPLLAKHGIRAISFGVNWASAPVTFPQRKPFIWKHPETGDELMVFYLPGGYGWPMMEQFTCLDNCPYGLFFAWNGDNGGGHSPEFVELVLDSVRGAFPKATVVSSDLESVVDAFEECRGKMETVVGEAGDTWIYGVPSDPYKVAAVRHLSRLRLSCISDAHCDSTSYAFHNFTRFLMKAAEHTWGGDTKAYLSNDEYLRWDPKRFAKVIDNFNVRSLAGTWVEQRRWAIDHALEALGEEHPITRQARKYLPTLRPARVTEVWDSMWDLTGFERIDPSMTYVIRDPTEDANSNNNAFEIKFEEYTGAISHLRFGVGPDSTAPIHATASRRLGELEYRLFDFDEVAEFINAYTTIDFDSIICGLGKAGLPHNFSASYLPSLSKLWWDGGKVFIQELVFDDNGARTEDDDLFYSAPKGVRVRFSVDPKTKKVTMDVAWKDKKPNKTPESISVVLNPPL
ncbi:hypothetical protein HK102_008575, partial [Quaeritorhiza haematococci]